MVVPLCCWRKGTETTLDPIRHERNGLHVPRKARVFPIGASIDGQMDTQTEYLSAPYGCDNGVPSLVDSSGPTFSAKRGGFQCWKNLSGLLMNLIQRYRWLGLLVLSEASWCRHHRTKHKTSTFLCCKAIVRPLSSFLIHFPLQSFVIKSQGSHRV